MSYSTIGSKLSKRGPYRPDNMQYNRAELMRMQEQGLEIEIPPKPAAVANPPRPNPPTVTITNLNIVAADDTKQPDADVDDEAKSTSDKSAVAEYVAKEEVKRVQIRHQQHWFTVQWNSADAFYRFLDEFNCFGLLAEKDGALIVTHYDDVTGDGAQYRTVKFAKFDRWAPARTESKSDGYKKLYDDTNSVQKRGAVSKTAKTIGIRHNFVWLQLTFRFEWEFDKFLWDSKCYALVNEHSSLV